MGITPLSKALSPTPFVPESGIFGVSHAGWGSGTNMTKDTVNSIKLAINIQHSPLRKRPLEHLLLSLNYEPTNIITDNVSTWSGCKKCLTTYPVGTTHVLVLQDDIIVCPDFIDTVKKIISLYPTEAFTFFTNDIVVDTAHNEGVSFAKLKVWFMAQAYVMPVAMAADFVAFSERHVKPDVKADDHRLAMYFMCNNKMIYATAPSLVEHLGWQSTTIGDNINNKYFEISRRVAKWFIGYDTSGLTIDWTKIKDCPASNWGDWSMFCDNYVD